MYCDETMRNRYMYTFDVLYANENKQNSWPLSKCMGTIVHFLKKTNYLKQKQNFLWHHFEWLIRSKKLQWLFLIFCFICMKNFWQFHQSYFSLHDNKRFLIQFAEQETIPLSAFTIQLTFILSNRREYDEYGSFKR